jgi:hypothetical protein
MNRPKVSGGWHIAAYTVADAIAHNRKITINTLSKMPLSLLRVVVALFRAATGFVDTGHLLVKT